MSKMLSKTFAGLDDDAREAARRAARRSGKSLDEWLKDAIFEKAEAVSHEVEDCGEAEDEDRLEAVGRRLAQAGAHDRSARQKAGRRREQDQRQAIPRDRDDPNDVARRRSHTHGSTERSRSLQSELDCDAEAIWEKAAALAASQRLTTEALENVADLIEEKLSRFDPQAIEDAIESLERRVRAIERQTVTALADIAEFMKTGQAEAATTPEAERAAKGLFGRKSKVA